MVMTRAPGDRRTESKARMGEVPETIGTRGLCCKGTRLIIVVKEDKGSTRRHHLCSHFAFFFFFLEGGHFFSSINSLL